MLKQYIREKPLEHQPFRRQTWASPAAKKNNYCSSASSTDSASTTSITTFTNPDFPRNIILRTAGTTADVKTGNIEITGTDINGEALVDLIAITDDYAGNKTGSECFKTVTKIDIPAQDDDGATYAFGVGEALGLDRKLTSNTVILAIVDNDYETSRPTIVYNEDEISSNSITTNTVPDGSKNIECLYYYPLSSNPT